MQWASSGSHGAVVPGCSTDGVALAQTRPLQLDAMSAMHDAIQNGIADRRVTEHLWMQGNRLNGGGSFRRGDNSDS
jgi:hypothetical protein